MKVLYEGQFLAKMLILSGFLAGLLISMCEDMTLPELRTEWEQLNRLREEFQDAANAFEKILDRGIQPLPLHGSIISRK